MANTSINSSGNTSASTRRWRPGRGRAGGIQGDNDGVGGSHHHSSESPVLGILGAPTHVSAGLDRRTRYLRVQGSHKSGVSPAKLPLCPSTLDVTAQYRSRPLPALPRLTTSSAKRKPYTPSKPASDSVSTSTSVPVSAFRTYSKCPPPQSRVPSAGSPPTNIMASDRSTYQSYHKPIRTRASTTGSMSVSQSSPKSTTTSASTSDSLHSVPETGVIAIGMALGSPTNSSNPSGADWQPMAPTVSISAGTSEDQKEGLSRSVSRKWGFLSRSKSKSRRDPARQASRADMSKSPRQDAKGRELYAWDRQEDRIPQNHLVKRTKPKHTPIVIPEQEKPAPNQKLESSSPELPPSRKTSTYDTQSKGSVTPDSSTTPATPTDSFLERPFLDVEIPNIKLDRYSVMFDSLLQQRRTSSLLARRRATLDKLKGVNERDSGIKGSGLRQPLNLGSPSCMNSPSLSLFPQSPGNAGTLRVSSPRARSCTSPAAIQSPLRHNLSELESKQATPKSQTGTPNLRDKQSENESTHSSLQVEPLTLVSKFHKKKSLSSIAGSAQSSPRSARADSKPSLQTDGRVAFTSPKWQTASSPSVASKKSTSSTSSPTEKPLPDPVEVSIARQISLSREQRKMLGPLRSSTQRIRYNTGPPTGAAVNGGLAHVSGTKGSRIRIVHPEPWDPASPQKEYRRSERVIVEAV